MGDLVFLYVSVPDVQNILAALKSAYTWLFSVFSGFWNTIQNNAFLMTATMIFFILSAVSLIGLLIITIAPASFGKSYSQSVFANYPNPNHIYAQFSKSGLIYTMYDVFLKRKLQKQRDDEAAQKAYEKVAEEQAALENKRLMYDMYKPMAENYFKNYPYSHSVNINGVTYFNKNSKSFDKWKHRKFENFEVDFDDETEIIDI